MFKVSQKMPIKRFEYLSADYRKMDMKNKTLIVSQWIILEESFHSPLGQQ